MRPSSPVLLLAALALPLRAAPAQSPTHRLVVHLTIDQLRPEYLDRYRAQFTGGLHRLLREGAYFPNGFQDHGVTETAPGHASTMSGRFPRSTGIVSNELGVLDPQFPLVGAPGDPASPFRFRGTVLGDWLRVLNPSARLLSVSRKDRGAILPLGRARGEAYWWAPKRGVFTTSRYYGDTLPAWVQRFNARRAPQGYAGAAWTPLLPPSAYEEPDSVAAEAFGTGVTFPHVVPTDSGRLAATLHQYPVMDSLTLALALDGVRALGLGADTGRTDFLAVSLSTTDAVGHKYGPDSRELHDQLLRLDRHLGAFLDTLLAWRDPAGIVLSLTADHGVAALPDAAVASRYRQGPGAVVTLAPVVEAFSQSLAAAGARGALREEQGVVYLDRRALRAAGLDADSVARAVARAARAVPGVARADRWGALAARDTTRDAVARRWRHMFPEDVAPAVVVTLAPHAIWKGDHPAMHGSPHDYDARVPVLFFGAGIRPGRVARAVRVVDIAPTLAAVLGITPQERLDGVMLREALR